MKPDPNASEAGPLGNPYIPIFILSLATFMEVVDTTAVNVALTRIASDLSAAPNEVILVVGSYLVANAAILPISGWLASYFGRKRYYLASVVIFAVGSLLCGLAWNLESLVVFRVIQGLGGGGLPPSEQAIIADITPKEKLGRAFSIYGFGLMVGVVIGPTLGGLITDTLGWHWIFFINVPIAVVSFILTTLFVKESKQAERTHKAFKREGRRVDWLGIGLFMLGMAGLQVVLEAGPSEGWFESDFVFFTAIAVFFAILIGVTWEYYQDRPAVDILMFKDRAFSGACVLIFAVSFVTTGSIFLVPYMAQTLLGYTATQAGMIGLPAAIVLIVTMQAVGYLIDRFDVRTVIFSGIVVSGAAVLSMTSLNLNVGYYDLAWARAFQAFGLGFLAVSINTAAYYHIAPEKNNSASALLNLARNAGASVGIALTSTILVVQTQMHADNLSGHASSFNPAFTQKLRELATAFRHLGLTAAEATGLSQGVLWDAIVRQASMKAILDAFWVYLILFACVLPLVFLLRKKERNAADVNH